MSVNSWQQIAAEVDLSCLLVSVRVMPLLGSWELTEVPNQTFLVMISFRTEFSYFGSLWIWKPSLDHQMSVEHMAGSLPGTARSGQRD